MKVLVARIRDENRHPEPGLVLGEDDVLLLGAEKRADLDAARTALGEHAAGRIVSRSWTWSHTAG